MRRRSNALEKKGGAGRDAVHAGADDENVGRHLPVQAANFSGPVRGGQAEPFEVPRHEPIMGLDGSVRLDPSLRSDPPPRGDAQAFIFFVAIAEVAMAGAFHDRLRARHFSFGS